MDNQISTVKKKPSVHHIIFYTLLVICLLVIVDAAVSYRRISNRIQDEQQFYRQLSTLQQLAEDAELSELEQLSHQAQVLDISVPELQYQILYRHWLAAFANFDVLVAGAENRYVSRDLNKLTADIHRQLLALRSECDKLLRSAKIAPAEQKWLVYNLRGSVSLMMAYSLLEFTEDAEKSRTFLSDAVEDFKQAIHAVDDSVVLPSQRMIPRWNLELIVGAGKALSASRRFGDNVSETLRTQLQAVIPNVGGYASGEPLETRVRK